jgi:hypothetical protein
VKPPHCTIIARVSGPASCMAISRRFTGMMMRSVTGQFASISSPPAIHAGLRVCHEAEQKADDGERRLHESAALVGRLPLREQGGIVKQQARGLLCHIHVQCGPGEHGGA